MKRSKFVSGKPRLELVWPAARGEHWVQKADPSHRVVIENINEDGVTYMVRSNKFGSSNILKSDFVVHYEPTEQTYRYKIGQELVKKPEYRTGMITVPILKIYGRSDGSRTMWQVRDGADEPNEYLLTTEDIDKYYEPA